MIARISSLFIIFLTLALAHNSHAQCDSTDRILQNQGGFDAPTGFTFGQSFVVPCSGELEEITMHTNNVATGYTEELTLYQGTPDTGTVIASSTLFVLQGSTNRAQEFQFDPPISVTQGQTYTFLTNNNVNVGTFEMFDDDVYSNGNTWAVINGTPLYLSANDLRFTVQFVDNVAPNARCKDVTLPLDANGELTISYDDINNGSNGGIVFRNVFPTEFDCNNIGVNTVTLSVGDSSGNFATCQATLTVTDIQAPQLNCPEDVLVQTDPLVPAIVSYDAIGYSDCSIETPSGFTFLAVHDNSSYYISNSPIIAQNARSDAESHGGFVATIWDIDHNDMVRSAADIAGITSALLIGYSDANAEGFFRWHGANSGYENWNTGEPNNSNDEDFTTIRSDGLWNDIRRNSQYHYILELSNPIITQTAGLPSGSEFPLGTTTNIFEASDASGNVGTCSFTVTVEQNPYETSVSLSNGRLQITDIENNTDDQITFSNDGSDLIIRDLAVPLVSGAITQLDATTVSVPLSNITNGIIFNAGQGDDSVTFEEDLTLNGSSNLIDLYGINAYNQIGAINLGGTFIIDDGAADIVLGEVTAAGLFITGANSIRDTPGKQISISGNTILSVIGSLGIDANTSHAFGGTVDLEGSIISFIASGTTTFKTVKATSTNVGYNLLRTTNGGDLILNGTVQTAGASQLKLWTASDINQLGGAITTDGLILAGRNDGSSMANLGTANNNIGLLQAESNSPFASINFKEVDTVEMGRITTEAMELFAQSILFSDETNFTKNGQGTVSFNANIEMDSNTNGNGNAAVIHHQGGLIQFLGTTNNLFGGLQYTGLVGTSTQFQGTTTLPPPGVTETSTSVSFGNLLVEGPITIGDIDTEIFNAATFTGATTIISGKGTLSNGPSSIENGATIAPNTPSNGSSITFADLTISSATYAPKISSDTSYDTLDVYGEITLVDATLAPTGGFAGETDGTDIVLINNDGNDPVVGTFNGYPEATEVTFGAYTGLISYTGGDGNDVVLNMVQTTVELSGGKLIITDVTGENIGYSDDNITLADDGTTLTIGGLISPVEVSGGPVLTTGTTVSIPLASITNGIEIITHDGNNFVHVSSNNPTGDLIITGDTTAAIELGAVSANNLSIENFIVIKDGDANTGDQINVTGTSYFQTVSILDLNDETANHSFGGEVSLEAFLFFLHTGPTVTLGDITTTSTIPQSNRIDSSFGEIVLNGDVIIGGSETYLILESDVGIRQSGGMIRTPVLLLSGQGVGGLVELDQANEVDLLYVEKSNASTESAFAAVNFTNAIDLSLGNVATDEFTFNAPLFNFVPGTTIISKNGTGESTFNGNTNTEDGSGTSRVNHHAGTITFNGPDNYLVRRLTYNGTAGTITNFHGDKATLPFGGPGVSVTFGFFNVTGEVWIGDTSNNILNTATFTGPTTLITGIGLLNGGPNFVQNGATITPGAPDETYNIEFTDLTISSATFAPLVIQDVTYDNINVEGVLTLVDAEFTPLGGFAPQLDDEEIVLIYNDDADPIVGTFNGLPEGAAISFGEYSGIVSYEGGDGNDFTLVPNPQSLTPVLLSEYQPQLADESATEQTIELFGAPGASFSGVLVVIENDIDSGTQGLVLSSDAISGTFDTNGLLTLSVPNLIGPSHTVVLTSSFTGTAGVSDIDQNDDGVADQIEDFGFIYDAVSVFDEALDASKGYGADLGGVDLPNIDDRPSLIFRSASSGEFYLISPLNVIFDSEGVVVDPSLFNSDPTTMADTFGAINPFIVNSAFVTTWQTNNSGSSNNNQISITTSPNVAYNYTVHWGDGTSDTGITGDITHTYANGPGVYTVSIVGLFPQMRAGGDAKKLLTIEQWGSNPWISMENAFKGCQNLDVVATDTPNLAQANDLSNMFSECESLVGTVAFNNWDVSTIENMTSMFNVALLFNQPIGNWNVGRVTNMYSMFNYAQSFNQDLNNWNTSKVEIMAFTFYGASAFNGNIGNWDVTQVSEMRWMFGLAENFNQDIGNWNTSNVQEMNHMFFNATNFNQNIGSWNTSQVTVMYGMFQLASSFNQNIGGWNTSQVTDMGWMFSDATQFDQDLGGWDVSALDEATEMFYGSALSTSNYDNLLLGWSQLNLQNNVSFGTDASYCLGRDARTAIIDNFGWIFSDGLEDCSEVFITKWETTLVDETIIVPITFGVSELIIDWGDGSLESVTTDNPSHSYAIPGNYTVSVFGNIETIRFNNSGSKLNIVEVAQWGASQWTSMQGAFNGCEYLIVTALDAPDLSNATDMGAMFRRAGISTDISLWQDISHWDVSTITNMTFLFRQTEFNQDISAWNVSSVLSMGSMFAENSSFDQNISAWDISSLSSATNIFFGTGLSTPNYDALLIGWSTDSSGTSGDGIDDVPTGVTFGGGMSMFCNAEFERDLLRNTYSWNVNDSGQDPTCQDINVVPIVFIQGAGVDPVVGEEDLMRDDLRQAGLLPTVSPFGDGLTVDATIFDITGGNAIVDWVFVELRDKNDPNVIIDSQSGLLQRDGDILNTTQTVLTFRSSADQYYVVVKHRNHLGVMTANPVFLSTTPVAINFSGDANLALGGTNSLTLLDNGKYALFSGDFDRNGQIQSTDLNAVIPLLGNSGYNEADMDLNGQIQTIDINLFLTPNLGKGQLFNN